MKAPFPSFAAIEMAAHQAIAEMRSLRVHLRKAELMTIPQEQEELLSERVREDG